MDMDINLSTQTLSTANQILSLVLFSKEKPTSKKKTDLRRHKSILSANWLVLEGSTSKHSQWKKVAQSLEKTDKSWPLVRLSLSIVALLSWALEHWLQCPESLKLWWTLFKMLQKGKGITYRPFNFLCLLAQLVEKSTKNSRVMRLDSSKTHTQIKCLE